MSLRESSVAAVACALAVSGVTLTGSLTPSSTDFEEAGFVVGGSVNDLSPTGASVNITNVNNCLQAWRVGNAGPTTEDEEIVDLSDGDHEKVWRFSQGAASSTLGSAPHSPNNGDGANRLVAGETSPLGAHTVHNDAGCGQPTTNRFFGQVEFKSVTELPVQMSIQITPSSADQRHGFVRIIDDGAGSGLDLQFFDTIGTGFNGTTLDLDLAYDEWHTLGIEIEFVDDLASGVLGDSDAEGNDIVKVIVDGQVVHCGTSWESFYASLADDTRRIQSVDRLLIGHSGPGAGTVVAQLGGGLYFDNVLVTDQPSQPTGGCPGEEGACCTDGPGTQSDCILATRDDCEANHLTFLGEGTSCDEVIDCVALVVTMQSMSAERLKNGVRVAWTTATEVDTVGFRVLRETAGPEKAVRPVSSLIPAAGHGLSGATYEFLDNTKAAAAATVYWIEDVDTFGRTSRHGPITVGGRALRVKR